MAKKVAEIVVEIVRSANILSIEYESLKLENIDLKEKLRRERLKKAGVEHELIRGPEHAH